MPRLFLSGVGQKTQYFCFKHLGQGEMLEGAREEDVQSVYSVVTSMFPTLPFDNASAFVAAALARKLHRMDLQDIPDKSKLRNDLYIMATGIQNACSEFLHNGQCAA